MTGPGFSLIQHQPGAPVIVLATAGGGQAPPPGTESKTQCMSCDAWLWMGSREDALVCSGQARPICQPCLAAICRDHPGGVQPLGPAGHYPGPAL